MSRGTGMESLSRLMIDSCIWMGAPMSYTLMPSQGILAFFYKESVAYR